MAHRMCTAHGTLAWHEKKPIVKSMGCPMRRVHELGATHGTAQGTNHGTVRDTFSMPAAHEPCDRLRHGACTRLGQPLMAPAMGCAHVLCAVIRHDPSEV